MNKYSDWHKQDNEGLTHEDLGYTKVCQHPSIEVIIRCNGNVLCLGCDKEWVPKQEHNFHVKTCWMYATEGKARCNPPCRICIKF